MEAVPVEIFGRTYVYPEKTPDLERLLNQGRIKELQLLSPDPTQILHINGNDTGTISIKILTGFYLSDSSLQSMYQLSKMVAVSGDNTLELAISMNVFPFYCSTNWDNKRRTLDALREITQLPALDISETARRSFNIFFDKYSVQTRGYTDIEFPQHDRHLQLDLYATLDFPSMINDWPKVSNYIRLNYNFYDRLDDLVREGLPADLQPKIETTSSDEAQIVTTISQTPQTFFSAEPNQSIPDSGAPRIKILI